MKKLESFLKEYITKCVVEASLYLRVSACVFGRGEKFRVGVPDQEIMIEHAPSFFIESKVDIKTHDYSKDQRGWAKSVYEVTKHMTYGVESKDRKLFRIQPLLYESRQYDTRDLKSEIIKWMSLAILSADRRLNNEKVQVYSPIFYQDLL